jgi:hypothetical protein
VPTGGELPNLRHTQVPGSNRNAVNRLDDVDDVPLKVVSAEAD